MKSPQKEKGRVVRTTMADGTVKEYRYAAYRRGVATIRSPESIAVLLEQYQRSPKWRKLSEKSQEIYEHDIDALLRMSSTLVPRLKRPDILVIRDGIAAARGDGAARGFIRAASAFFSWCIDRGVLEHNPAARGNVELSQGHFVAWTQEQAATALEKLPEHLRRVLMLALYTGARRGDLANMKWAAYDGETVRYVPMKTSRRDNPPALAIPCHPTLKAELDAWRGGSVVPLPSAPILTNPSGMRWDPSHLSAAMGASLRRIGLPPGLNLHGVRKLFAASLAEAGCSTKVIAALTGHKTLAMVQFYTESAEQPTLAAVGIDRLSYRKLQPANASKTGK